MTFYMLLSCRFVWFIFLFAQSAGAVEYTDCISAEGVRSHPPTSVLDMTQNNLMLKFQ